MDLHRLQVRVVRHGDEVPSRDGELPDVAVVRGVEELDRRAGGGEREGAGERVPGGGGGADEAAEERGPGPQERRADAAGGGGDLHGGEADEPVHVVAAGEGEGGGVGWGDVKAPEWAAEAWEVLAGPAGELPDDEDSLGAAGEEVGAVRGEAEGADRLRVPVVRRQREAARGGALSRGGGVPSQSLVDAWS